MLRYLRIASARGDSGGRVPDRIAECFRERVRVEVFRGRGDGAVSVEYRIPVEGLSENYAEAAARLIQRRSGRGSNAVVVSREALRILTALAAITATSVPDLVEQWAFREWKSWMKDDGMGPD